jgi:dynein heavy chain
LSEDVVLIKSLRDSNLPKFLAQDVPLFKGILSDLFPGVNIPEQEHLILKNELENQILKRKLTVVHSQIDKILQLYDTLKVRHGIMIVGPTGGGKTTIYETLKDSLTHLRDQENTEFFRVKCYVLNPKCITMSELYGEFNLDTMEWKDGLIGNLVRAQVADTCDDEKWTIFDGPVDAVFFFIN